MVPVADAVSDEHAVVLPLEDTTVANVAVPGAGRGHRLTRRTKVPLRILKQVKTRFYKLPAASKYIFLGLK